MASTKLCETDEMIGSMYFDYILPSTTLFAAILLLPVVFIYCKSYMNGNLISSKPVFYGAIILFTTVFAIFTIDTIAYRNYCANHPLYLTLYSIPVLLYVVQTLILAHLLFIRLYTAFHNTSYAVSKCLIISWFSYSTIALIIFAFGYLLNVNASSDYIGVTNLTSNLNASTIAMVSAGLLLIFGAIWLVSLFIYKLMLIHKKVEDSHDDAKLLTVITKIALLFFLSSFITILSTVTFALSSVIFTSSFHARFVFEMVAIIDMYTNCLCLYLSYNWFDGLYQRLCGCCHSQCNLCWSNCFKSAKGTKKNVEMNMKKCIEASNTTSSTTENMTNSKKNMTMQVETQRVQQQSGTMHDQLDSCDLSMDFDEMDRNKSTAL